MRKLLLAIISLLLIACQPNVVYNDFVSLPSSGWHCDSVACFDIALTDSINDCSMLMTLRHTDKYAYQNIWLFVDVKQDSLLLRRDTVNAMLADKQGQWYASGVFIKEIELMYLNDVYLPTNTCQVIVQQAMRTELLKGVSDIGLKIIKNTENGKE